MDTESTQVRKVAGERGLTSLMNDTKWREVCETFRRWSNPPRRYRVDDLCTADGHVSDWDRKWYYHPRPYVSVRWLEVELPASDVTRATAACKQIGAAVEVAGAGIPVWGWVGGSDRPQLV